MEPNWSGVSAARDQATSAATSANDFSAKGNVLVDELRKAVGERFGESGIAKDTATARTDFMAAAPKAREDVLGLVNAGSILSPTQQNAIMAAKRSSALMPLMGANLIQDATFGTMEDIINAGTNAFKAETQNRQGLAQIAQGNYSSLLNELLQKAQEDRANQTMQFAANRDARETAMAPFEQMTAEAKLANLLAGGDQPNFQQAELGGKMYNYNPKTGQYTESNAPATKSNYGQQAIVDNANALYDGKLELSNVPLEIRGQVFDLVKDMEAKRPWYQKNLLGIPDKISQWFGN